MIGTLAEAKAIHEAMWDRWEENYSPYLAPEGWDFIGQGSTRTVFLSPSGVAYKLCDEYEDDWQSYNDRELENFARLRDELPEGFRVPEATLHVFTGWVNEFNYSRKEPQSRWGRVAILAVEYIEGSPIHQGERPRVAGQLEGVGLFDTARGNVLQTPTGYVIVDAGEGLLDQLENA